MSELDHHVVVLHAWLGFTGGTARLIAMTRALVARGARVTILARDGSQRGLLESEGHTVIATELPEEPWKNPFATWRLARLVAELEPDVLHVTSERLATLAAWVATWHSLPYVLEVHRPLSERLPMRKKSLAAVGLSAGTLTVSAVNHGRVPRALIVDVPHEPDPDEESPSALSPARPAALESGALRVGMSGLLDQRHGTEVFLEAARELHSSYPQLRFVVLGEGPCELELRRFIRRNGLSDRATIAVPVTQSAARTLGSLDVHVSCRVGGPDWLTHLALALGVPSILCASGIAFELVEDGVDGVLVERDDPGQLAAAIAALVETPLQARALGQAAHKRWITNHPPGSFARHLAELHARALQPAEV